ncbi:MAG: biotin/lipoyl-containing protein [Anaerocolumna sp.]
MDKMPYSAEEIIKLMMAFNNYGLNTFLIKSSDFLLQFGGEDKKTLFNYEEQKESSDIGINTKTQDLYSDAIDAGNNKMVVSPIVGTFYSSTDPNTVPFVDIGSPVKKGDIVCIIESMKLMNEVRSEYDGIVKDIMINNCQPVEYGQPIMIIEPL